MDIAHYGASKIMYCISNDTSGSLTFDKESV